MFRPLLLVCMLLSAVSGCGGGNTQDASKGHPTLTAGPQYANRVNTLCADLIGQIRPITGDKPNPSPQEFLSFGKKIDPVIDRFDNQVDALEVTAADRSAKDAFDAYRLKVDSADGALRTVARTGDPSAFTKAFATFLRDLDSSPETAKLSQAGITCPAR